MLQRAHVEPDLMNQSKEVKRLGFEFWGSAACLWLETTLFQHSLPKGEHIEIVPMNIDIQNVCDTQP